MFNKGRIDSLASEVDLGSLVGKNANIYDSSCLGRKLGDVERNDRLDGGNGIGLGGELFNQWSACVIRVISIGRIGHTVATGIRWPLPSTEPKPQMKF